MLIQEKKKKLGNLTQLLTISLSNFILTVTQLNT